ncbi:diguanylate cyclase [Venatoribacter cucullus]|uniref:diguanylate cyclase n=1 Tax=Venatoribacter cucullus TaxID=2661630 RepID=A0A9X7UVW0_9GAMM|nr:diguanylate cyclase [Venatoribacter cucullus]QQD23855.1 diguanylate cyclase [Venatoribacter cucullus]
MQSSHTLNQDDALEQISQNVDFLTQQLHRGRRIGRFPRLLEHEYLRARNRRFLEIDRRIIAGGLLFYLAFCWSDILLGGASAQLLVSLRVGFAAVLFALLWWVPRSFLAPYMMVVAAVGVFAAGASVLFFITLIPAEMRFAYHLGMVPIQVFTMVALRLSMRAMLTVSLGLFALYVLLLLLQPLQTGQAEMDQILMVFVPLFVSFWLMLIGLGAYLAYAVESGARNDYVQNRLLTLEAVRLKVLTRQLHELSTTDSLTGIANRRYFEQQLDIEWRRAIRQQQPLALVMIDADRFKDYNDCYGHQQGDICLQSIAGVIAAHCQRPADLCARFGGEEFVLLLPGSSTADAARLAEKIRLDLAALQLPHERSEAGFCTLSAGVAAMIPAVGEHSDELLRRADRRLYQAKDKGRNCVVSA